MEGDFIAKSAARVERDAEFALAVGEQGFELRIALQPVEHFAHLPTRRFGVHDLAALVLALAGLVQLLPAIDEAVGTQSGIGAEFGFELERADGAVDASRACLGGEGRILLVGGFSVAPAVRAHFFESIARPVQLLDLLGARFAPHVLRREDRVHRTGMAHQRPRAGGAQRRLGFQAYSRTNRILNEVKSQGNIVAFRNLKNATDEAIALFADKGANETILIDPYESYVARFNEAAAMLRALTPTVDAVDALQDENAKLAFVRTFRELARLRNILSVFAEFDWGQLALDNQTFDDFKSKYLDIYELTRKSREEGTASIVNDVDFEIELVRTDRINVADILNLLREIKADENANTSPMQASEKRLADIMDMVASDAQLRSKRDLIEKFIQQNMPMLEPGDDVAEAFKAYWDQEKEATLAAICVEEGLDRSKFDRLIDHFNFSGQNPLRDDVVAALNIQPKILERRKVVNRILERLIGFIRTFEDDMGEV